jgi:cyclase
MVGRAKIGGMPRHTEFSKGLHELGDGCFAYLQPDGSWGWSNAGLVVGDGVSLLVDTLFDLELTAEMLGSMAAVTRTAPIGTLVNTHANGDHCYGNELVQGAEVIASAATAHEMTEVPPAMLAALNRAEGEVGALFRHFFGSFSFDGIEVRMPTRTFEGRLEVEVGGRTVELIEVGPAHTKGDTLAYVPDARTVYTGDILFIGGTPIVWAGPLSNWVAACDLMLGMDIETVVPGHGPVTDKSGVAAVRDYLAFVDAEATARHAAGVDAWEAARQIAAEVGARPEFRGWSEFGRISVNVDTAYRSLDPGYVAPNIVEQFRRMAELEGFTPS